MNTKSKKSQGKPRRKNSPGGCDAKSPFITCEQVSKEIPFCPICGGMIPSNEHPGAYPGATSRVDNSTEICSRCGTLEGFMGGGFVSAQNLRRLVDTQKFLREVESKIKQARDRELIGKEVL